MDKQGNNIVRRKYSGLVIWAAGILLLFNIIFLVVQVLPSIQHTVTPSPVLLRTGTPLAAEATPTLTALPSTPTPPAIIELPAALTRDYFTGDSLASGTIILSVVEEGYSHLYGYSPAGGLTRLTSDPWDDIDPDISPDGNKVAFSSKRNGYWNIYILELDSGSIYPLTDTPAYDSHPRWSPDGSSLLFETYQDGHFNLAIIRMDSGLVSVHMLLSGQADYRGASWSTDGTAILLAGGDLIQEYNLQVDAGGSYQVSSPVTLGTGMSVELPVLSPDGEWISWAAKEDNLHRLVYRSARGDGTVSHTGLPCSYPIFSPDSRAVICPITIENTNYLSAYSLADGSLLMPIQKLPGRVEGISWSKSSLELASREWVTAVTRKTLLPAFNVQLTPVTGTGRYNVSPLNGIDVAYPYLHDAVDESFNSMRERLVRETGWDVLGGLQSALIPISSAPDPDGVTDWLYTGRGIALYDTPLNVGWMALVKEEENSEVYFRILVRPLYQDGSLGRPVLASSYNLRERFNNEPSAYDAGGAQGERLDGYWVDLTDIAARYGWHRLPALPSWINYLPASRYNLLVKQDGLNWQQAMRELYPDEVLATPVITDNSLATTATAAARTGKKTATPPPPAKTPTSRPTWTPLGN